MTTQRASELASPLIAPFVKGSFLRDCSAELGIIAAVFFGMFLLTR